MKISVAVSLETGGTELVTLASDDDAAAIAADLAAKHALAIEQQQALESDLAAQWADGCANAPDIYVGPMPKENELHNLVSTVELPSVGVVLEVADSVVTDGGRGLFIRCLGETETVTLDEGTAVCGYADGTMKAAADSDKSVAFALASPEAVVWFERELRAVDELLSDPSVDEIAGHVAQFDASGSVSDIALDVSYDGPRYFVPAEPQPSPLAITAFGQMANDLAIDDPSVDTAAATYDAASEVTNLLVLVFRLERQADNPRVLVPTRPISTTARSITLVNDVPMELGCRYGARFWRNWRDATALSKCFEASDLGGVSPT